MIEQHEYEERWRRAQDLARERGLDGLIVWSRGGAMTDSFADVLYLTNHYSPFPLVNDALPKWAGRSHSAFVLPLDREPALVVDIPDWRRDLVAAEDVRFSLDVPAAVADTARELGLAESRIGLVGGNAMVANSYRRLLAALTGAEVEVVDDLVESLRRRKSPAELELIRASAALGNQVVGAIMETAREPGRTEGDAIAAGYAIAVRNGAAMYDAATASGPFSHFYSYGRLPSWTTRTLEAGDFFHIDCYGTLEGYLWDFARTTLVGGRPTPAQREVLEGAVAASEAGVAEARAGNPVSAIYHAVVGVLTERGLAGGPEAADDAPALAASLPAHGHSYGLFWEAPWIADWDDSTIEPNMCLAIELMAGRPDVGSVKLEQDVIITDDGQELLTTIPAWY